MERATVEEQLDHQDGQLLPPSHGAADVPYAPGIGLARKLGWFGIGLGIVELAAPRVVEQVTGVRGENLLRANGLREIASGIGILASARPTHWLWARVAGDAIDLATLAVPLTTGCAQRRKRAAVAAIAVAGVTLADVVCATQLSAAQAVEGSGYRRANAGNVAEASARSMNSQPTTNPGASS
jgi:hypothetical protein